MADNSSPGLGDLLGLFGGTNPLGGITKSIGQFQKGVGDFLNAVQNFNSTMEQLNGISRRVNGLLDTVEEPIKAFVPQITRTIHAADSLVQQLSAPIEKVAPGLSRLADTLSSPMLTTLPGDLTQFMETLSDLARRLAPLGQIAESAGSMFGLKPLSSMVSSALRPTPPAPPPAPVQPLVSAPPVTTTSAKKAAAKKAPAKKAAAKKAAAKKATPPAAQIVRRRQG